MYFFCKHLLLTEGTGKKTNQKRSQTIQKRNDRLWKICGGDTFF